MRMSHTHLHHSILHAADHDSSVICYCRTIVYIHLSYMYVQIYFNMIENVSLDLCIQDTYTHIYIYMYIRDDIYDYVNIGYSNHPSSSMHKKPSELAHLTL